MFGRKGLQSSPSEPPPQDGYAWIDAHLARYNQPGSMEFAHALGLVLFDSAYHAMKNERGVRIEDIVAMLSSVAGHLCLNTVLDALRSENKRPQDIEMIEMRGHDGQRYFFGDAPNRLLCEAEASFISLVFGAAHQHGGRVSIEMLHAEMQHVAARAGKPDFLELDLPTANQVDSPLDWARHFTPFVQQAMAEHFRQHFKGTEAQALASGGPPDFLKPRIVGFAVQQAIDSGHASLDPTMLAWIAMGCALRTAKLDPERVFANA